MSRSEHLRAVPGLGQSGRASEKADQSLPPLGRWLSKRGLRSEFISQIQNQRSVRLSWDNPSIREWRLKYFLWTLPEWLTLEERTVSASVIKQINFCEHVIAGWRDTMQCSLDKLLGNLFVCAWEISERVVQHGARPGSGVAAAAPAAPGAWRSRVWFRFRCEVMPAVQDGLLAEGGEALPVGGHQRGVNPGGTRGQMAPGKLIGDKVQSNVKCKNCLLST